VYADFVSITARLAARARYGEPGRPSASVLWALRWIVRPWVTIAFRPRLEGVENLPHDRPFTLVANHGAGFAVADILSFAVLWRQQLGDRALAGFAHPFAFHVWPVSWLMKGLGSIPSSYEAGRAALEKGVPIVVFPGGDYEAGRSFVRGNTVDFGGRAGFVRLAKQANVPIVPMGIRGNRFPTPILFRSRAFAWIAILPRAFGVKRYPVSVLAVAGAIAIAAISSLGPWRFVLAWAWMSSPFALIPWVPWPVRIRIGSAIEPADASLEKVEGAVRELVARR
jgi:1-acyl-sn-glycerol-3-phosphate acyltransferase